MDKSARKKIFALSGSTRNNSANEALLRFIADDYRDRIEVELYGKLAELPHFNPDLDKEKIPPVITDLRRQIEKADGVIICTPEYVFSLPGALKNALEWTVSTTVFLDKPVAVIVASGLGEKTFESLILIMSTLGAKMRERSNLLIQGARSKLNEGQLSDERTKQEIEKLIISFLETIDSPMPRPHPAFKATVGQHNI